jgi:iron complex outermembrane receptor protein
MSRQSSRAVRGGLVLLGAAALAPAYAQDAPREATSALEEIIVTAQKREESLQSVPIAVTALDAAQIEKTYSRDIQDIETLVPNLIVDPILGNGTASISIRGMQLNDVEKSFDPAVAVYLDGIYLANTTGALLQMYDAEAVEVLRGPQGTLFGRNTIGGLLNIRRAKPTGEMGGKLALNVGRFNQIDARGVINFPSALDGRWSSKVSVVSQQGGGYFQNVSRNTDEGNTDFLGLSFTTLYQANDNLDFLLTLDYFDDNTPTRPVTALTAPGEVFCPVAGSPGCGQPKSNADYHRNPTTTLDQQAYVKTKAATLNTNWQLSDSQRIVSVTGWRDVDDGAVQEFDGTAGDVFSTERPTTSSQFSEELRLESDWNDRVRSTLGVYYFDSTYELNQKTFSPAFFGPPMALGGIAYSARNFTQDVTAYAAFGQVDWDLTDALTLSLGGRYSNEKKTGAGTEFLALNSAMAPLVTTVVPIISYGNQPSRPAYAGSYVDPVTGATVRQDGEATFSKFTPRVNLTYKINESKMVYATYSEGFRSGGFNGRASDPFTLGPYDPELVKSFEIGAKTQWLDNRVRLNIAAFTTDYTDKQEDVVFPDPVAVTVTVVQNASAATLKGGELEFLAVPTPGLTLGVNLGFLDASFDDWTVQGFPLPMGDLPNTAANLVDKSGFELRRAPKYTAGFNAQYEQPLPNERFLVYSLNYSYKDDYYIIANTVSANPTEPGKVDAYGLLDASISYETPSWRVSLWGKNLTQENYFVHVLDVGTLYASTPGPSTAAIPLPGLWTFGTMSAPRTYGVEFQFKF